MTMAGSVAALFRACAGAEVWSRDFLSNPLSMPRADGVGFLASGLSQPVLSIVGSPAAQQLTLAVLLIETYRLVYSKVRSNTTIQDLQAVKARQQHVGSSIIMEFTGPARHPAYRQLADALGPLGQAALSLASTNVVLSPEYSLISFGCHCTAKAIIDAGYTTTSSGKAPAQQSDVFPAAIVKPLALTLLDLYSLAEDLPSARLAVRTLQAVIILPGETPYGKQAPHC
jgi:hypothetical protein